MSADAYSLIVAGMGILIGALGIPLILCKVPMNNYYGIRFSQSFKSDNNWYEINSYGGKALLISSIPIVITGLLGFMMPDWVFPYFALLSALIIGISVTAACIMSYLKAREIGRDGL